MTSSALMGAASRPIPLPPPGAIPPAEPPCIAGDHEPNDAGTACAYCGLPAVASVGTDAVALYTFAYYGRIEAERPIAGRLWRHARNMRAGYRMRAALRANRADYAGALAMLAPYRGSAPGEIARLQAHGRYIARLSSRVDEENPPAYVYSDQRSEEHALDAGYAEAWPIVAAAFVIAAD